MDSILEILTPKGKKLIDIDSIKYILAANRNCIIYFNDNSSMQSSHLLKWFTKRLPEPDFYRCHRTIIVNCNYVDYYSFCTIILKGDIRLPLSRFKGHFLKLNLKRLKNKILHQPG